MICGKISGSLVLFLILSVSSAISHSIDLSVFINHPIILSSDPERVLKQPVQNKSHGLRIAISVDIFRAQLVRSVSHVNIYRFITFCKIINLLREVPCSQRSTNIKIYQFVYSINLLSSFHGPKVRCHLLFFRCYGRCLEQWATSCWTLQQRNGLSFHVSPSTSEE